MDCNFRKEAAQGSSESPPSEAWLVGQALLGNPIPNPFRAKAEALAERKNLEWLARLLPRYADELRKLQFAEAEARHEREMLEWMARFSTRHADELRTLLREEAATREAQKRWERFYETHTAREAQWNSADHPRAPKGQPDGGRWVDKDGGGGSAGTETSPTFLDAIIRRNQTIADLSGVVTPGMIRSNGIAKELQSAARLPGEIASWASDISRAGAAGLGTGGKAVVNGFATAVKGVATLGLNTSQLELIGVTKEDRARGYDTAVAISTASGQVLIAVGTGGITSALSKGGSVARAASGALILYDAAGNAVGVVQGVYDATQKGVHVANGVQVAAGALGLAANFKAARGLNPSSSLPKGFDPAKGFETFQDFKDAFGAAGPGHAWHHVVEQTINSGKFAPQILHNPANLFRLPHGKASIHARISAYYSSRPSFTGGLTVRQWLSKKSFKEQFDFGVRKIKELGGSQYLPPHLR